MDRLNKILKKVREIPTLPKVVENVLSIIDDPEVHILKIADLIQQDFTLTTKILRIANSPYYAQRREIVTILEAIVLLGLNTVKELVIAASCHKILNKKVEGYLLEKGDLWKHSLCCAISSEIIADEVNKSLRDKSYIAGLLHDIGKLILAHYVEEDFLKIISKVEKEKVSFDIAEEEIIGFSHAKLGAEILKKWGFSDEIVRAIEYHHKPDSDFLANIVHIADAVSIMLGQGLGADGLLYKISENSFDIIGIKKEEFEKILSKTTDTINSMRLII
jgi:putative nucleotidyltransferase with HDIG domain